MWQGRRSYDTVSLVAIVIVPIAGKFEGKKYLHGLKNTTHYKYKFANDMKRKFPDAVKINFYIKSTGEFLETIHLE